MWALPRCMGASPFQGPHQGAPYFRGRTWRRSCLEGGIWGHSARQTWEEKVGPCWKKKGLKEPPSWGIPEAGLPQDRSVVLSTVRALSCQSDGLSHFGGSCTFLRRIETLWG